MRGQLNTGGTHEEGQKGRVGEGGGEGEGEREFVKLTGLTGALAPPTSPGITRWSFFMKQT